MDGLDGCATLARRTAVLARYARPCLLKGPPKARAVLDREPDAEAVAGEREHDRALAHRTQRRICRRVANSLCALEGCAVCLRGI